jgi:hypothetical protein
LKNWSKDSHWACNDGVSDREQCAGVYAPGKYRKWVRKEDHVKKLAAALKKFQGHTAKALKPGHNAKEHKWVKSRIAILSHLTQA